MSVDPARSADDVAALDAAAVQARQEWNLARDAERLARQRMREACDAALYARRRAGLLARSEQSDGTAPHNHDPKDHDARESD